MKIKKLLPFIITALFVGIIVILHKVYPSMFFDEKGELFIKRMDLIYEVHTSIASFAKRPLTSLLVKSLSDFVGISIASAFIIVNAILLWFSGLALFFTSLSFNKSQLKSIVNVCVYYLSFTVVFAFFDPIYTYDEPFQYLMLFLASYFLLNEKYLGFIVSMIFALVARESSVLLLPAMFFFLKENQSSFSFFSKDNLKRILVFSIPVFVYGVFSIVFISLFNMGEAVSEEMSRRFDPFNENFKNQLYTLESIYSFVLVMGIVLYFYLVKSLSGNYNPFEKKLENAFILSLFINTLVVFIFTFAREARLFALPLIFVWMFYSTLFEKEIKLLLNFKKIKSCLSNWKYSLVLLILFFISYQLTHRGFQSEFYSNDKNLFNEYFFATLMLISFHLVLTIHSFRNDSKLLNASWK